jgi:hypothetical protein
VTQPPKNVVASVLARSPHAGTVLLKGALMLRVWGVPRARPTMDIDLLRRGIADQATLANDFARVVGDLAQFLMPAAKAAATSADYPVRWEPLGPWQRG